MQEPSKPSLTALQQNKPTAATAATVQRAGASANNPFAQPGITPEDLIEALRRFPQFRQIRMMLEDDML